MVVRDACGREGYTHPIQGTADGSCREWSNLLDIQMRLPVSVLLCDPGTTIIQHRRCFSVYQNEKLVVDIFRFGSKHPGSWVFSARGTREVADGRGGEGGGSWFQC